MKIHYIKNNIEHNKKVFYYNNLIPKKESADINEDGSIVCGCSLLPISSNIWSITGDKIERKIDYVINRRKMSISVESRAPVNGWVDVSNSIIRNVSSVLVDKGGFVRVAIGDFQGFMKKEKGII